MSELQLHQLKNLHPGYVVKRLTSKERIRVCVVQPSTFRQYKQCEICFKDLSGDKCLRHEKGSMYLFWECFSCYIEGADE